MCVKRQSPAAGTGPHPVGAMPCTGVLLLAARGPRMNYQAPVKGGADLSRGFYLPAVKLSIGSALGRLIVAFLLALASVQSPLPGCAQYRNLPKAGFQTRAMPAGDGLPQSTGLHLTPGMNRTKATMSEPYDPRHESLGLVRWEASKMPIHVWIAPGLKLPDLPLPELKDIRVDMVRELLGQAKPFATLPVAPGWTPETNDVVAAGIEEWRGFESEGLLSFDFTDDPRQAHILVFFTDSFTDASSPGGINVGGNTCSQPLPMATVREIKSAGKKIVPIANVQPGQSITQNPVVIELSTQINSTPAKMRGASAHEFGHALGIITHSPYREDLMYVDRVVDDLSPADKATFRALYRSQAQGSL